MHTNRIHKSYLCKICGVTKGVRQCKCKRAYYCSRNCQLVDWKTHKSDCFHPIQLGNSINNNDSGENENISQISPSPHYNYLFQHHHQQETKTTLPSTSNVFHLNSTTLPSTSTSTSFTQPSTSTHTHAQHNSVNENFFANLVYPTTENTVERDNTYSQFNSLRAENSFDLDNNSLKSLPLDFREREETQQHFNFYGRDDQLFDQNLLQVIENSVPFNYQFEDHQLLQETKRKLEQELLCLNNNNNNNNSSSEFQESNSAKNSTEQVQSNQNLLPSVSSPSEVKLSSGAEAMALHINEKFMNQPKLDDQTLYHHLEEQFNLEEMCCSLIRDLNEYGVCVIDDFLGSERGLQVLNEVQLMHNNGTFKDGQLVSVKYKQDIKRIRGDKIAWIGGKEPNVSHICHLINQVDSVVTLANRMKNNGQLGKYNIRERTKAMVACYEDNGAHYVKHVDNPNHDGRCITAIYYLNLDWDVRKSGGLLRIFPENMSTQVVDIEPIFDRLLFFWSDRRNPHEVQNAFRTRYAVTLWYFDDNERKKAVNKYQRDCANNLVKTTTTNQ